MGQITIRGIDPGVEKEIRRIAKDTGKSINLVIQEIIYKHSGIRSKQKNAPSESLREFAGGWSEKEADEFIEAIRSNDGIDEELWK